MGILLLSYRISDIMERTIAASVSGHMYLIVSYQQLCKSKTCHVMCTLGIAKLATMY